MFDPSALMLKMFPSLFSRSGFMRRTRYCTGLDERILTDCIGKGARQTALGVTHTIPRQSGTKAARVIEKPCGPTCRIWAHSFCTRGVSNRRDAPQPTPAGILLPT